MKFVQQKKIPKQMQITALRRTEKKAFEGREKIRAMLSTSRPRQLRNYLRAPISKRTNIEVMLMKSGLIR